MTIIKTFLGTQMHWKIQLSKVALTQLVSVYKISLLELYFKYKGFPVKGPGAAIILTSLLVPCLEVFPIELSTNGEALTL